MENASHHDDELGHGVVYLAVVLLLDLVEDVVDALPDVGEEVADAGREEDAAGVARGQGDPLVESPPAPDELVGEHPEDDRRDEHPHQDDHLGHRYGKHGGGRRANDGWV